MFKLKALVAVFMAGALSTSAHAAELCEFKPSPYMVPGVDAAPVEAASLEAASVAIATATVAIEAAGAYMKKKGLYAIRNARTGSLMLGSSNVGPSGRAIGILAGTSGALASVGAVVMSPVVRAVAGINAVGLVALEAGCEVFRED